MVGPRLCRWPQKSGRAQVAVFTHKSAEPLSGALQDGQFQVLPLNRTTKEKRGVVWVDLNRDGLTDLLVAEPDSGQLGLHLQQPGGSLASPRTFPSLTGVSELAVADWDGDGQVEIFLLSADERQIGVTRLDRNNRIGFPEILPPRVGRWRWRWAASSRGPCRCWHSCSIGRGNASCGRGRLMPEHDAETQRQLQVQPQLLGHA